MSRPWLGLAVIAILGCVQAGGAQDLYHGGVRRESLERDLRHLASDEFGGRGLGDPELQQALTFVAQRFRDLGLEPAYPEKMGAGDPLAGYFQPFHAPGFPTSANVIGVLRGDRSRAPSTVVVGAHVDHLGRDPQLTGDQIYNGADDNASGVAALLEIARILSAERRQSGGSGERTVLFIAFSAEESGLLGSKHYVANPLTPAEDILAMINLDSVGRLRDDQLIIFGTGTAREFSAILGGLNPSYGFDLAEQKGGVGAADHTSFFVADIPVLHLFTGPHEDYSKVSDEADKINYAGLAPVTEFTAELTRYLAYRDRPLTFQPGGEKQLAKMETLRKSGERKVSLGFMPDFSMESGGVKVGPVFPGAAAAEAGIQTGDVIVALGGERLDSLVDYTAALRQHAPGDRITVVLLRDGREIEREVVVQERR